MFADYKFTVNDECDVLIEMKRKNIKINNLLKDPMITHPQCDNKIACESNQFFYLESGTS